MIQIGKNIRYIRDCELYSQKEFAEILNRKLAPYGVIIKQRSLSNWEADFVHPPLIVIWALWDMYGKRHAFHVEDMLMADMRRGERVKSKGMP